MIESLVPLALLAAPQATGPAAPAAPQDALHLALELERRPSAGPDPIDVTLRATLGREPLPGLDLVLTVVGGSATSLVDLADGRYVATVTPARASGEVTIDARVVGTSVQARKTALVLPLVDDRWNQPEAVPGLVNSAGWEDSCEVSPDGEWLIVGTYSPVDLVCCLFGCSGAPADPAGTDCNAALGPYAGPARPGMLGADRIVSPTSILHEAPSLGLFAPLPFALPPVAAYGFRRSPSGAYEDPFVIGFDMDGFSYTAFAFSFVEAPVGGRAQLVFGFPHPLGSTGNDVYWVDARLDGPLSLGAFSWSASTGVTVDAFEPVALPLDDVLGNQGNPHFVPGELWFDDEGDSAGDVFVATHAGTLPGGRLAPAVRAGFTQAGRPELQPFKDAPRVYFYDGAALRSVEHLGGPYELASSWSAETVELAGEGALAQQPGAVLAIGEPSIARDALGEWLYFVYVRRTSTGLDADVGRVPSR